MDTEFNSKTQQTDFEKLAHAIQTLMASHISGEYSFNMPLSALIQQGDLTLDELKEAHEMYSDPNNMYPEMGVHDLFNRRIKALEQQERNAKNTPQRDFGLT